MKRIYISDNTLCQVKNLSFKEKIEVARGLDKLNVDCIELPAIENVKADTLLVKTISAFVKSGVLSVGAGNNLESVENAAAALASVKNGRIRIEVPLSSVGMEYTLHKKGAKLIDWIEQIVSLASSKCKSVEFMAIDATRAEKEVIDSAIKAAVKAGASIVSISDNAAEMLPDELADFVSTAARGIKAEIGISISDKNGLAVAGAALSVKQCATIVKTTIIGDGIALDTFGTLIKHNGEKMGCASKIKYTELNRTTSLIRQIKEKAIAVQTSAKTSEVDLSIKLDVEDDKETVRNAASKLGYDLSEEDVEHVYDEFKRVAAKKPSVGAKELDAIIASSALQVPPTYKLDTYIINNGNIINASAQVSLIKDDASIQGVSIGDGPIDAAFRAIEQVLGHHYELDDFQIHAVTEGKEAVGSAMVKLRAGGKIYSGSGISTDIIGASIRAYINAVNKIVYEG
ncbi:MAG: hypothetical protein J6Y68_00285 [Clostridia bacterium]|nr:hypothetical protein [Clostridia bacterium]